MKEVVEGRGGVWSWFRALVGSILVLLLLTLLLGGVEYEGRLYRPLPYHPLRWVQAFSPSCFSLKHIPFLAEGNLTLHHYILGNFFF
jgi:hypothetical protein